MSDRGVIEDTQLESFVHSSVSNEFGLSVVEVAENCKDYGRFKAWLNSDVGAIVDLLNVVRNSGVSPSFFASYERTEGYNPQWGWLNHTVVNGDPITDAISVSEWIVSQSNNTTDKPAWIDYANFNDFVPENVKQLGNADFESMTLGSIGRVVIAGTAAATWEVYYPLGLLKEYNGVQNYGKPITNMMTYIISWGGVIEGGGGGKPFYPVPENIGVSSHYGWRYHPIDEEWRFHDGTDFPGGGQSHPIYATQSGEVILNAFGTNQGNYIRIKHNGDPYYSGYQHLAVRSPLQVGEYVTKGQVIGQMGNTGASTGIHLHFQIATHENGFYTEDGTIDPMDYLEMDFGGGGGGGDVDNRRKNMIVLLLTDALNGWKY